MVIARQSSKVNCSSSFKAVEFHRLFNIDIEHYLYTKSSSEKSDALDDGFEYDGAAGRVFKTKQPSTVPFYHLYNEDTQTNSYPTNKRDRDARLVGDPANVDKGVAAWIFAKRLCGSKPLYRLDKPASVNYFYTTDEDEKDYAETDEDYNEATIAGYIYKK
ncbi:hypothetical protein C8R43DRAFT_1239445 [Mycena crocata]|nr:hypothetical protein C8R43DRAFT_1239445 [Mycena crocata]